jgi:hypothetical protein
VVSNRDQALALIGGGAWEDWGEASEGLMVALVYAVLDLADAVRETGGQTGLAEHLMSLPAESHHLANEETHK